MRKLKHIIILSVLLLTLTVFFSCIPESYLNTTNLEKDITIRVLIDINNKPFTIESQNMLLVEGIPLLKSIKVESKDNNIIINDIILSNRVEIYSDGDIYYKGTAYSGFFRIILTNNEILVINVLPLEKYLESVVPSEVPALWPMEVLKAQAISSRTYALRRIIESTNREFDVYGNYKSQVYRGLEKIHPRTTRAVKETKGMVLTYSGEIILAFFHANSGGLIESPEIITTTSLPYLQPMIDKFSQNTFRSSWETKIPIDVFLESLGINKNSKFTIHIPERLPSGSIPYIEINLKQDNSKIRITTHRLREIFPSILSPKFEIELKENKLIFRGYGWGHGVGLSQWGAKEMASQGYNYKEIIRHYYKDVEIKRLY
ncbi:MAG: SpoIID/LytB domain-containing protein [Brevinematia bacterium]